LSQLAVLYCCTHSSKGLPCMATITLIGDGACAQANSCGIAVPCQHNSADTEFEFTMLDERQKTATHIYRRNSHWTQYRYTRRNTSTMQQCLIALHYALPTSVSWLGGWSWILTSGSTLHHCQSVIKVLVNSAMLPENLPTPPLVASRYRWIRCMKSSDRMTLFTHSRSGS
jgi:hypothetical protein